MKLKYCYIENFGTLSKKEYSFEESIKIICEDNGMGKSTLAVFIKAILFGLNKTTRKDLDDNERLKYKPWQGGNYGGYLDFWSKGKLYRVERYFDDKEGDRVRLIDLASGNDSEDYDKNNLGAALFGIDEAGYEKSTYFSQRDAKYFANGKVYSKLTDLLEEENDMGSFEQAKNLLDDEEKAYKKRSQQDILSKIKTAITEAQTNLATAEEYEALLTEKVIKKREQTENIKQLETEQDKVKAEINAAIKRAEYDKYIEYKESYQTALRNKTDAEAAFLGKIPTDDELENISQKINAISHLQNELDKTKTEADQTQKELNLIAEGKTPDQEELNKLAAFFNNDIPDTEHLDSVIKLYQDSVKLNSDLSAPCPVYRTSYKDLLLKNKIPLIIAAIGVIILLGGVIADFFNPIAEIVLSCVGSVTIAGGILAVFYRYLKDKKAFIQAHKDKLSLIEKQYNSAQKGMSGFLQKYNMPADNPLSSLMKIKESIYGIEQLSASVAKYADAVYERQSKLTAKIADIQSSITAFNQEATAYLTERGEASLDSDAYIRLRKRFNEYSKLSAITATAKKNLDECPKPEEDFANTKTKYDLNALGEEDKRISEEINLVRKALISTEDEITKFTDIAAQKNDYLNEIAVQKEELKKQEYYLDILQKTKKYLEKAKTNLTNKYLSPIKESFVKYLSAVTGKSIELIVNEDFQYEIYESGAARDNKHFSSGYRDLFDICARLSLTDALYKDEKPFLVLDDPFKNLDDGKMSAAKTLLDTLSEEYQIIYLVCHTSRKLDGKII